MVDSNGMEWEMEMDGDGRGRVSQAYQRWVIDHRTHGGGAMGWVMGLKSGGGWSGMDGGDDPDEESRILRIGA